MEAIDSFAIIMNTKRVSTMVFHARCTQIKSRSGIQVSPIFEPEPLFGLSSKLNITVLNKGVFPGGNRAEMKSEDSTEQEKTTFSRKFNHKEGVRTYTYQAASMCEPHQWTTCESISKRLKISQASDFIQTRAEPMNEKQVTLPSKLRLRKIRSIDRKASACSQRNLERQKLIKKLSNGSTKEQFLDRLARMSSFAPEAHLQAPIDITPVANPNIWP